MNKFINLTGKRFSRLFVLRKSARKSKCRDTYWMCQCDCGVEKEVVGGQLKSGKTRSCGCLQKEKAQKRMLSKDNPMKDSEVSKRNGHNKGKKTTPHKPDSIEKHRQAAFRNWSDDKYVQKQMRANGVKPNNLELRFERFLNELYPGEWKYVGDGQLIINGKCPDFVNVNGQKKIIELYGDYWHRGDNPEDRAKVFEPFGYQTLVIWENEFKNMEFLKTKIREFAS